MGTKRFADDEEAERQAEKEEKAKSSNMEQATRVDRALFAAKQQASSFKQTNAASALPFSPVDLAWRNIHYSVPVTVDGEKKDKVLLNAINGFAKAGTLTALMGSSGAGKTTLMDVLAGRKTVGKISGEIMVNGFAKESATFNRICGFVEQQDIHLPTQTVREALLFSAHLRLPRTVTEEQRVKFVEEVLEILELKPIADRIIGDSLLPGLSPGQLKRVTIGVELVANPPILFLDEPTSGLDSRAALVVMTVVKRISFTGRSVLCTIHQPSAELFEMFDRLLLLKSGGMEVFFGDLGADAEKLVQHFETAPVAAGQQQPKKPKLTNPASWMLDVIGAGTGAGAEVADSVTDYHTIYEQSALKTQNELVLKEVSTPIQGNQPLSFDNVYAASYLTQFHLVTARLFQFYWRNPSYVWVRQGLMLFMSCFLGFLYLQESVATPQSVVSKFSGAFVGVAFPGWIVMSSCIPILMAMRAVIYREQASFMFTPYAHAFAISFVEIFYTAFSTIVFLCCYYPMTGWRNDATSFFQYFLVQYLVLLVWLSLGQVCASALPNTLVANIIAQLIGTFSMLFSGTFIMAAQIAPGWKWIYYMDWFPKAMIPIASTQFSCIGADCPQLYNFVSLTGQPVAQQPVYDYVMNYVDSDYNYWGYIGWQLLTLLVFRLFIIAAIGKINYLKR